MARRGSGISSLLTLGGRVPPAVGGLLLALVVLSVLDPLSHRAVSASLGLSAADVFSGEVWRLATWSLIAQDPIGLVFAALWIWQTGSQLAWNWGSRRFAAVWLGITAASGLVQVLVALAFPAAGALQATPWPLLVALLLMWALAHPGAQISWFGMLPMTTEALRWVLVGGTALFAIFAAPGARLTFVTNFAALGIAWIVAGPGLPFRRWWYRMRAELHVRSSRRRAKASHIKVVKKNGEDQPPRWMN